MLNYEKPRIEIIEFESDDIIATSGKWPGWGYDDENHDHHNPPGQGGWHPEKPGKEKKF